MSCNETPGRIGDALVAAGKVAPADLERALAIGKQREERLGAILVRLGLVSERDVVEMVARQLGMPLVRSDEYPAEPVLPEQFAAKFLRHHLAVPLTVKNDELELAVADPHDRLVADAVALTSGKRVRRKLALPSELDAAIERLYGSGRSVMDQIIAGVAPGGQEIAQEDIEHLKDLASEAPVIRLVNLLIERAVEAGASDVHVEPFQNRLKVRYRIDGILQEQEEPPQRLSAAVISRLKIMARLDIAERRLPQDGRIQLHSQGREIDLRISTVPTMHGESVVIRLLRKEGAQLDFQELGFATDSLAQFQGLLERPHGILLVTGPTGSGKTTTLYAALRTLNDPTRKILTVEDPVEYELEGVNQLQVKPAIGLDFARALRSLLRQDPDVIMIGEMRDTETARIAVQSAMTGHLVLSTLHTNDAVSSITRLLDMGIEAYLVTSTLNGALAQRLVRRLCPHCREAYAVTPELAHEVRLPPDASHLYRAVGCEQCGGSGYHGRVAIIEILAITDAIRALILRHADAHEIAAAAVTQGMRTMYQDGLAKAQAGMTSLDEVLRVTRAE
ncbi:MAG TPA: type II secretion system ATPase GspE [Gammaproteobacteria bacterium]